MDVDVYESTASPSRWLLVPAGTPVDELEHGVAQGFTATRPSRSLQITRESHLVGLDANRALDALAEQGFFISMVRIEIRQQSPGAT